MPWPSKGEYAITEATATEVPIPTGRAPRFTIVTSTFNAAASLPVTARSLAGQTCRDFEWLVMDGASPDGTAEVARGFGDMVTRLVSEPNSGIYDAWNKALPLVRARGDLGQRVGLDAAVVALRHLRRQQLAPGRVDALADDDERAVEADDDFLGGRRDDGIGHVRDPFKSYLLLADRGFARAPLLSVPHDAGGCGRGRGVSGVTAVGSIGG